jgi:hypothetical protein
MTMMVRSIVAFHQDDQGDWIAELSCGHRQHVRHRPPWINHPWVTTDVGRQGKIGQPFACAQCPDEPPKGE